MNSVTLEVNGRRLQTEVEPRTHLGDFLRDTARLTGTHLGCEHGVCGACTVLVDGRPVRSCITFTVACEGRHVTTVEGYEGDEIMRRLREAFTRHHALQCGFCTPGMLATGRDIVLRLPEADEARIRLELAGNLCRCTGYMGIVAAIGDVLGQLRREPHPEVTGLREKMRAGIPVSPVPVAAQDGIKPMPAFAGLQPAATVAAQTSAPLSGMAAPASTAAKTATKETAEPAVSTGVRKGTQIDASFDVPFAIDAVWAFMGDLPVVAGCLPGAAIESQEGDKVKGRIAVKFGPMSAAFVGAARLERDDARRTAVLRGAGQDSLSQSRAQGDITYRLEAVAAEQTRVHVDMLYSLQGPLAQFSRSGLVKDFVRRMVADFGQQVSKRMAGDESTPVAQTPVSPLRIVFSLLLERIRKWFGRG
ncbi:MAG: 2Fe-2S iron-sulfur cluster-binding protein [Ottowia sp.]|uniref:xanthine dehydrogenase family Fe-S subunit n=1 Tax=Ottowia sp. TaxID=1898956 RepID=UPI003C724651